MTAPARSILCPNSPNPDPGVTRNEALRMAGNGVVRQQALAALTDMLRFVPAGTDAYTHRPIREESA